MCQETLARDQQKQPMRRFGTEGDVGWLLWSLGKNHNYPNDQDGCVHGGREKKSHEVPKNIYVEPRREKPINKGWTDKGNLRKIDIMKVDTVFKETGSSPEC